MVDLKKILDEAGDDKSSTHFGLAKVASPGAQQLRLVIVNETFLNSYLLADTGSVTIGRSPEADIFVPHPSVSRRHAVLHLGPSLLLEDLGSSNGSAVNNVRLAPNAGVAVAAGDVIRLGGVYIHLQRGWDDPTSATDAVKSLRAKSAAQTSLDAPGRASEPAPEKLAPHATSVDLAVGGHPIVVRSPAMERVFSVVAKIARTEAGVLVLGETGVGKEIVAHAIHVLSKRKEGPFLTLNCAALAEPLLESELFGHEKGAFTGAHDTKAGLFEKARGGTVFLDEIGDMSLAVQAKLLRVFEDRTVLRLGSLEPRPIDVRFVTATNKNLRDEVAAGRFRKDFYFRLTPVTIQIPPLRERTSEIEPLARLFLQGAAAQAQLTRAPELARETVDALMRHSWPGNVRELKHAIEHAVYVCDERVIRPDHLVLHDAGTFERTPLPTDAWKVETKDIDDSDTGSIRDELHSVERERIVAALEKCGGNQTRAAELLGIPRRTFVRKLRTHGLRKSDPRESAS